MARLNEPVSAAMDSMESLKRKFLRQNRDIARANSTQSVRIRNLENEVSRLLTENLTLREEILELRDDIDKSEGNRLAEHVKSIRTQMEANLQELSAAVSRLGEKPVIARKASKLGSLKSKSPKQSPDQRGWKSSGTFSEAIEGQEGHLPPILEYKTYPRRTLEHQEIDDLIVEAADVTDSPELGPPPVSQFVDANPVKIDLAHRSRNSVSDELPEIDTVFSMNLEQRKKRRDSTSCQEPKRSSRYEAVPGSQAALSSLKSGAKRKLSLRDEEDDLKVTQSSRDEVDCIRVNSGNKVDNGATTNTDRRTSTSSKTIFKNQDQAGTWDPQVRSVSNRKVLAPKSVNGSPRKNLQAKDSLDREGKPSKVEKAKIISLDDSKVRRKVPSRDKAPSECCQLESIQVQKEPGTPAGSDLISPPSSQPSTVRIEARDTPPPTDLGHGDDDQRPTRRARASVNYAQPNLRDKMRRPTKQLVDAVLDEKTRRASISRSDQLAQDVKRESGIDDDAWKILPSAASPNAQNSPLCIKTASAQMLPDDTSVNKKRRESMLHTVDPAMLRSSSTSSVQRLLAESRESMIRLQEKRGDAKNKAHEGLDIYDFNGSSPLTKEEVAKPGEIHEPGRDSRRQTVWSREMRSTNGSKEAEQEVHKRLLCLEGDNHL